MPPVLVINVGSSTIKLDLYQEDSSVFHKIIATNIPLLFAELNQLSSTNLAAVGHRVVHGGPRYAQPTRITPDVLHEIEQLVPFAPLHLPKALAAMKAVQSWNADLPQVACFDTAFHRTMPIEEQLYGLPRQLSDQGLRKYGFHGLSYESIVAQLPAVSQRAFLGSTVVCHLGSGASLCGMKQSRSLTTTMGFSPLDGLLMGTRCGRLDPGIVLYLLHRGDRTVADVAKLLERESGLLGVSGSSADMRDLLASESATADEAIRLYCRMVAKEIAAACVVLDGLDAVIFTGGVGENAAPIRERICQQLTWLGLQLDPQANKQNATRLQADASKVEIFCLPSDEAMVIAKHTAQLLGR